MNLDLNKVDENIDILTRAMDAYNAAQTESKIASAGPLAILIGRLAFKTSRSIQPITNVLLRKSDD